MSTETTVPDDRPETATSVDQHRTSRRTAYFETGAFVLLLGLSYLYLLWVVDSRLVYHLQFPEFLITLGFFTKFLTRPGGLVDYLSLFLGQLYFWSSTGALVITVVAGLICLATRGVLKATAGGRVPPWTYLLPLVPLMMTHGQYWHPLVSSVSILAALALVNLYVRLATRRSPWRVAGFLVLSAAAYYAAGGAYLLYAALCGIFELLRKRSVPLGVAYLLLAPAVPSGMAIYSYRIESAQALYPLCTFPTPTAWMTVPLLLCFALVAIGAGFGRQLAVWWTPFHLGLARLGARLLRRPVGGPGKRGNSAPDVPASSEAWTLTSFAVFLVVGALMTFLSFDSGLKSKTQVDYYGENGDWERVLEAARRVPSKYYDIYVVHDVNRALFYTGRLPREMCSYPQAVSAPGLRLGPEEMTEMGYEKFARFCFELGNVNFAHHYGNQTFEMLWRRPLMLKMLIRVNVLKGRPGTARTFLGYLSKSPLYRNWALEYQKRLDADPLMSTDPEVRRVRPLMHRKDFGYGGFGGFSYQDLLLQSLTSNRRNRMAFEYLMAGFLLTRQHGQIAHNIRHLDDFDYIDIPRHYEEALVLYLSANPEEKVDLRGRQISRETIQRLRDFAQVLAHYQSLGPLERKTALKNLAARWGDSYFFFDAFGYSQPRPGWERAEIAVLREDDE